MKINGNTLHDSEGYTQADAISQSPLLGLDATKDISLNGNDLRNTPERKSQPKTK